MQNSPLPETCPVPLIPYRWIICALPFFATTINYTDRQILSLIKPILDGELHWTNAEFGMVNLATDPNLRAVLLQHRELLARFGRDHNDPLASQLLADDVKPVPFPGNPDHQ